MRSKEPKVLVVTRSTKWHGGSGGMESVADSVASGLADAGFRVSFLTTAGIGVHNEDSKFEHIWSSSSGRPGKYSIGWWKYSSRRTAPWHDWSPDLILSISHSAVGLLIAKGKRTPIISQCHGTALAEVRSSLSNKSLREIAKIPLNLCRVVREIVHYRASSSVVAIGNSVQQQLSSPPYWLKDIVLIENGVTEANWAYSPVARSAIRRELGIDSSAKVLITASRLHRQKGVDIAIQMLSQMEDKNSHLLVCGDGPELSLLRSEVGNLKLGARVHFVGAQSESGVARYLSAADLFVFPSRRKEGLPMSILEALANGLPVLTVANANPPAGAEESIQVRAGSPSAFAMEADRVAVRGVFSPSLLPSRLSNEYVVSRYRDLIEKATLS